MEEVTASETFKKALIALSLYAGKGVHEKISNYLTLKT